MSIFGGRVGDALTGTEQPSTTSDGLSEEQAREMLMGQWYDEVTNPVRTITGEDTAEEASEGVPRDTSGGDDGVGMISNPFSGVDDMIAQINRGRDQWTQNVSDALQGENDSPLGQTVDSISSIPDDFMRGSNLIKQGLLAVTVAVLAYIAWNVVSGGQ